MVTLVNPDYYVQEGGKLIWNDHGIDDFLISHLCFR